MKKLYILFLIFLTSCFGPSQKDSRPVVLVTLAPYATFVNAIAGDAVSIEVFVPAGANPHTYEPVPKQVERFSQAKVWFRLGDPIEDKIVPFLRERHVKDIDLTEGMKLLSTSDVVCEEGHSHGSKDLHVWLDPVLVIDQAKIILDHLVEILPEQQEMLENNYEEFVQKLSRLNDEIAGQLIPFQNSYLLVSHPSLGYYCARYDLHQISVECEGKDPRPQQVEAIVKEADENDVRMVLIEPQQNNKGAQLIGEKLNLPVYQIDPLSPDYFDAMRRITKLVVQNYGD